MKSLIFAVLCWLLALPADGAVVYSQAPASGGGLYQSSWWDPDGSDYDQYVWDGFILDSNQAITQVEWRGGYDPARFGSGGPVLDFTVAIYASIPAGIQPDVVSPPLVEYHTGDNGGETPAGVFGGAAMYDYRFTLPAPFQATAGTKYWVQIEAFQHGIPDWGIAAGSGEDGQYFRRIANVGDIFYQLVPGDAAFALLSAAPPSDTPTATASPTPVATETPTPTSTAITSVCAGDCDGGGTVAVNEIIILVGIALGTQPSLSACPLGLPPDVVDVSQVDVALLIRAVGHALAGCARAA